MKTALAGLVVFLGLVALLVMGVIPRMQRHTARFTAEPNACGHTRSQQSIPQARFYELEERAGFQLDAQALHDGRQDDVVRSRGA